MTSRDELRAQWQHAYLLQAEQDLHAATLLYEQSNGQLLEVGATFAMLLQMSFEKIAKAHLLATSDLPMPGQVGPSHKAASLLIQKLQRRPYPQQIERDWGKDKLGLLRAMGKLVLALESAHPSIAGPQGQPQLEYPWQAQGRVCVPTADLAIAREVCQPKQASSLLALARWLLSYKI